MTENYPSDADLNALSGTSDDEQEVLFIPTGESPYYTSFYRMLQRLLLVARRAGDLRVFADGDLTFGVRAGRYFNGDSEVDCSQVTGQSLTNNAANYIYLTAAGVLTVNTTGFPVPSVTPHIPLAAIVTAAGTYDGRAVADGGDVTDYRGRAFLSVCGASGGNLNSLDWQESLLDELDFTVAEPGSPTAGDRYLNTGSGASSETAQTVAANDIEEWNGTNWTEITPTEGACTLVEDRDMLIGYNGAAWVDLGTFANIKDLTDGGNADGLHTHDPLAAAVADPGDAGAIAVTKPGTCPLVTAGAETRTLAIPTQVGRILSLAFKTDGGDCVITVASAVNQAGNNTLTFTDIGEHIMLIAIDEGAALAWRVMCNNGVALTTV